MAKSAPKKTAKTSSAKTAKKAGRPRAKKAAQPMPEAQATEAAPDAMPPEAPVRETPGQAVTFGEPEPTPLEAEASVPAVPEVDGQPAPVPEGANWVEALAAARSKPVSIEDTSAPGTEEVQQGGGTVQLARPEPADAAEPLALDAPPGAGQARAPVARATGEAGIPEQFLTIAIPGVWDDRMERVKPGRMGAAVAGSVLLELAVHGKLRVQQGRFTIEEEPTGDADLDAFAAQVAALGPLPTRQVLRRLGRRLPDRIRPWKQRAERRGWLREERRRFLGLLPRSTTSVLDGEVQGKLQNRLVRMLAGGGNPDVKSIALLGLIQAAGLLPVMVPSAALAFNEKRIALLLSGRDPLHYRVDTSVRQVQDAALRTILADVRQLS